MRIGRPWQRGLRLAAILAAGARPAPAPAASAGPVAPADRSFDKNGYELPRAGRVFSFPADDGAHPSFRIEWWYVTGQLRAPEGRRFGFQATFFRFATAPERRVAPESGGSDSILHLAHMALTDVDRGVFRQDERLNREGWDARAAVGTLDVRNGEWSLRLASAAPLRLELLGGIRAEASFALSLAPEKPLTVFGANGVSRKGAESSAASYYLTFSRLRAEGEVRIGREDWKVEGLAWMDHEISSSQLGSDQSGWDWVCVQWLGRPRELMLYRMRRTDGSADPASRLQWVEPDGRAVFSDFKWEVLSRWKSPRSGATYPSRVRLTTHDPDTGREVALTIEPLLADQELAGSLGAGPYWEGACRVVDGAGRAVGNAYLELTGYARPLKF